MASDNDLTIAELSALADVPVRTIRYYISQGLLPAPGREGPSTRYSPAVLARLRLIKRSRDRHLPLAAIRTELASLTDVEAIDLAETPDRVPEGTALDYVRALLAADTRPEPRTPEPSTTARRSLLKRVESPRVAADPSVAPGPPGGAPASDASPATRGPSPSDAVVTGLGSVAESGPIPAGVTIPGSQPPTPPATPERSQWERIVLEPDIELHVRRPLSRPQNRRVERLLAFARELTEGEQP